jgi:hypothetical protein
VKFKLDYKLKESFQEILKPGLYGIVPNITTVLRIFVSLPASVASGERNFNVLKPVKNFQLWDKIF